MADLGEAGLLAALERLFATLSPGVLVGVGDDAAMLRTVGPGAVLTTDLLIEGIDFDFRWASPADVGHKAAAVNISDLAAMGARPRALLLSLGLRGDERAGDVLALTRRLAAVGKRHGAPLVGGDLSRTTGPLVVSVAAVGEVKPSRALRRRRGRPGDVILVSGELGGAAAGLALLSAGERKPASLTRRQLRPEPRVSLGLALARWGGVRSCADTSDGIAADAMHVAAPGCAARIEIDRLPMARGVDAVARRLGREPWELALSGGEDFELVLAVPPSRVERACAEARAAGTRLTRIGVIVRGGELQLVGVTDHREAAGWDHFARSRRRLR